MNDPKSSPPAASLSRRHVFAGAGAVGTLAAVASVLPLAEPAAPVALAVPPSKPEAGGGYQDTPHVQSYYRTARV